MKRSELLKNSNNGVHYSAGLKRSDIVAENQVKQSQAKAKSDYIYATTPILSATGKNSALKFNPIAVEGAPINPDSGVRIVSREVYDAAMAERERQEREKTDSRIAELQAKLAVGEKHDWRNPDGEQGENEEKGDSALSEYLESHKVTDPVEEYAKYKNEASNSSFLDLFKTDEYKAKEAYKAKKLAEEDQRRIEYNKAYRAALNEKRAEMGLSSMSPELFAEYEKVMSENEILSSDNEYVKNQKIDNVKTFNIMLSAISQSNFGEVSKIGAETSADKLEGNGLKTIHNIINGVEISDNANRVYSMLTENEKAVWNYYIGVGKTEVALDYIRVMNPTLEARLAQTVSKEYDEQGFWGDVKEIGASLSGGFAKGGLDMMRAFGGVGDALGIAEMNSMQARMFEPTYAEQLANYVLADTNGADGKLFNGFLAALNSIAYQAPSMAFTAMGGGMAGYVMQGIGANTTEGIRNNTNSLANVIYGVYEGAMEYAVDRMLGGASAKLAGKGVGSLTKALLNHVDELVSNKTIRTLLSKGIIHLSTTGSEMLEEFIQTLAEPAARAVIYGEKMDYSLDTLKNALEAAMIGGIAGFIMGFGTTKSTYRQYQSETFGNSLISTGKLDTLVRFAEDFGATDSTVYDSVKEAVENKNDPDPMEVAQLYSQTMQKYNTFDEVDIARFVKNTANKNNVDDIANMLFNGNTEVAQKFVDKYSKLEIPSRENFNTEMPSVILGTAENYDSIQNIDEGQSQGYNENNVSSYENDVFSYENNDGGNVSEETSTDPQERGQGGYTRERSGLLQADLGGNDDQGRATRIEQGKSSSIRSSEGRRDRSITPEQSERLKNTAIKNDDGTPKAVYHFTDNMEFDVFAKGDIGFHFGNETQAAARGSILNKKGRTITAYLDIKSPLIIPSDIMCWRPRNLAFRLFCDGIISEGDFDTISELDNTETYEYDAPAAVELRRILSEKGYDGIVYQNMFEGDGESYIAFYPEQVIIIHDGRGDTYTTAAPGENSDSPSLSDSAPTGITELSAADKKKDVFQRAAEDVLGYKELSEEQKTIRDIGRQLGWKVVFAPVSTPKGRKADGKISFATKTITIDPTSKKPIQFILKHELAHSLEQNKGAYSEFQNAIMDCQAFKDYVKAQGFESASEYNADIVARYKAEGVEGFDSTNAEYKANCEMVANFVGNCLFGGNTEITAKLLEGMNTAQRRSFTEWIKDFFAKIRDKLSGKHKGLTDEISRLEDAFLKTLNSVQQKENTAENDGESYSFNENLHQQLQDWLNGGGQKNGTYNGLYFELGTTPSILTKHGAPSAEIVMYSDVIVKVTGGKHSISLDEIAKLPAQLNDPILLFKGSVPNSFVALTEIVDKNGNDVIVAVHINKRHSRTVVNKIASLYSKSDDFGNNKIIGYIKNQISAGNLIDASNTKAPNWFTSRGLQLPKEVQTILGANNRIAQKPPIVKNNSMQESDEYSLNAKENTADVDGEADAYSINEDFYSEFDAWDGKDTNKVFTIGTTSEALKSVNIKNQEIKMRSGMILQKLSKHPEMSREIFRNIPDLLEQPIIVQFSDAIDQKTGKPKYDSRITVLGELYANMVVDGKNVQKPVLVSLELLPTNQKKTKILDVSFVTSAYTKDALQQYINENSILYIEPNKKRTNKWLSLNRLSLPLGENQTGPIRKITYSDGKVKVQNSTKKTEMQLALEKAGVINSYGNSIFNNSRNDTSDNESFSISSASTSHTEILTQLKNGEITVEEADRLLYNSIGGNGDTHYGEHIHHTPSDYKPTSEREWQVFCRSFANQTNGMKDGEYRAVSVFTADAHYLISADGYMSGVIVDKISIDEYEERKEFYDNIPGANVSNFRNEENGSGQGNYSNSGIASQDEGTDSFDVELDAFIESHSEWFANKGKTRSNYSRIIEKSTETDESYSISEKTDIDSVLDAVSRGEMSTEEAKALLSRKKPLSPAEIANMKEADANTTPKLKRRQGENKGDKESRFYKSLMGSSIFDDTFKQEAADDSFIQKYQSVTNAETLKKAAEALDEGGEEYVKRWDIIKPEEASLIDTAVGFILMDRYQRVGDYHSAIKVAEKVKAFGTAGGQKIQLFSILSRLDPNTMVIYSQRELTSAFNILQKKRTQKWIDQNASRFNLTDEEMEFIRRRTLQAAQLPEGRDKARLLAEIAALLQDKLPPERGQGMKALQRVSMLLSPKTNERNFLGNAGMVPVFIASDFFGSGIDRIVSKQTGVRTTGMFDPKSVKGFAKGVFETMDDFRRHINTRNEELNRFETGKINKSGKAFNEQHTGRLAKQLNDCAKVLNALDRFTSFCLEMGDRPFYEMWYVNSINNQMKLNNTTEATPEMIQIACLEALQRTWQDTNKLVKVVTNAKDALNVLNVGGYGLGDIMVKFVKTPANLTKAIVDFSPAGVVKAIAVDAKNLRNAIEKGQYEASLQKKFVDSLSKGIAGSMLYVLAAALAGAGMLSGAGDEDKDVSNFEKYIQGMPEYSIKLFGKWWSYDWMQPVGSVFATVADYMKTRKENPDSTMYEDIIEAIRAGGEVLYNQSFMQSIQILFTADNPIDGFFEAILNDPSVLVPQFVSQIANVTDDYRRVTYEAGKPFETALNKVKIKIPGLRQTLDKQVDVLGRDVPNPQNNIFNAFFNPGNTYTDTSNAVTDEVYALLKRTGELSVIPRKAPYSITKAGITRQLTAEQTNDYQRMSGNISAELLEVIFDSSDYKELDDAQKVDIVTKVYDYAAKYAKAQLDIYDYETLSAIEGTKKNGEPILSKSLYNRLDAKAKQLLIDEAFYTKAELKCKGDTEKLVKLFMKQVKE